MDLTIPDGVPVGVEAFLAEAGWTGATIDPLPGDASFRRYFRIRGGAGDAMLMHAPPPQEDPAPFLRAAKWLDANGLRAPRILAERAEEGFVLLEDFGDVRMREYVEAWPQDEEAVYRAAIDALLKAGTLPAGPFPPYGMAEYLRETKLFTDWFCPARGLQVDARGWAAAWEEVLTPLLARQGEGVTVLRDYHAENIMLLGGTGNQGLLDFQDALAGHPAYDLVSLLQDARRDVSAELEAAMFDYYVERARPGDDFLADYAVLGAQRNAKIVGIFVRLWKRDGKPRYLGYIPRVWAMLERDLAHPALAPVARWFDANIPGEVRAAGGGVFLV
ncbi:MULTISPECIES: aminoglycoside phosphotransferase family protein [unclassified Novosphingobium]|uniref:aminoglycoside phosphotransferase family protein n=1 Tax=unclassified Novosphingobium TaxID=2644732 RepID=UPI000F6013CB|nr:MULTISPECIES: phosphotransferase [unclassified Novosphingobium]RQW46019.1 aminoglycoside phosphotransferase [Novosphingobium sp. LASN5T]